MNVVPRSIPLLNPNQRPLNYRRNNMDRVNEKTDQLIDNLEQLLQARRMRKLKERYGS